MAEQQEGNVRQEYNNATTGLNLDQSLNQIQKGRLTYALNAAVENFDSNSVNYQNELGNEFCIRVPEGFVVIRNNRPTKFVDRAEFSRANFASRPR